MKKKSMDMPHGNREPAVMLYITSQCARSVASVYRISKTSEPEHVDCYAPVLNALCMFTKCQSNFTVIMDCIYRAFFETFKLLYNSIINSLTFLDWWKPSF